MAIIESEGVQLLQEKLGRFSHSTLLPVWVFLDGSSDDVSISSTEEEDGAIETVSIMSTSTRMISRMMTTMTTILILLQGELLLELLLPVLVESLRPCPLQEVVVVVVALLPLVIKDLVGDFRYSCRTRIASQVFLFMHSF